MAVADGMGIALVSSQPQWGGGEQWLWSLGEGLSQLGARVHWIVPQRSPMAQRLERSSYSWLPVHGKGRSIGDLRAIRQFIGRSEIDLVHFNDSHAVIGTSLAILDYRRVARVWTKHTIFPLRWRQKYRWMIDRVICVSRAAQKACIDSGLRTEQTSVIYGAVDPPKYDPQARGELLREFQWSSESPLIVCVGNLLPCKGHRYAIEAMPLILKKYPLAKLVIAGEGKERSELEHTIAKCGVATSVKLLGFRTDATRLLSAADVVVQPSLAEALSLVAVEAQMLLKPLVATAVGGLAEVIGAQWQEPLAEVIQTSSSTDLARGVAAVLTDGANLQQRWERAKLAAHERFSIQRMVAEIADVYGDLIHARQGLRQAS